MTIETETTSTGSETASEEGQEVAEAQETPEGEAATEETATETAPEAKEAAAEEGEEAEFRAILDEHFGEAAPEATAAEGGERTFTQADLDRARQSAADSASAAERQVANQQAERNAAQMRINADLQRDVDSYLQQVAESGQVRPAMATEVSGRFRQAFFEDAVDHVFRASRNALIEAAAAVPGMAELSGEDLAPLSPPFRSPREEYAAYFDLVYSQGIKQGEANKTAWAEKEANRRGREAGEALLKAWQAKRRNQETGGEVPKGEATSGLSDGEQLQQRLAKGEQLTNDELKRYNDWAAAQSR